LALWEPLVLACRAGDADPKGFVLVEGGTFTMGSPDTEEEREDDEVEHPVTLRSFYLGTHEVTQREWQKVMGTTITQQWDKAEKQVERWNVSEEKTWELYGVGNKNPVYYVTTLGK
jgi:formylglycine-generating enzyme required for sulfatase activity